RRAGRRRFAAALLALGLGLAISLALATGIGRMDIGWKTVDAVILGKLGFSAPVPDHTTEVVIWDIRLSRVGALATMAAVVVLSRESGRIRKESLILAGIVVSTFLAAIISLIKSLDE